MNVIPKSKFQKRIDLTLQQRFRDPALTPQALAEALGMSRMHLHRHLRKYYDQSASAIIRGARIDHAKKLLYATQLSIGQISELSGFKDPAHFSRVFKRTAGLPPIRYRSKSRQIDVEDKPGE